MSDGFPPPNDPLPSPSQRPLDNSEVREIPVQPPPRPVLIQRTRQKPVVTYVIMGVTILVFVLQAASLMLLNGQDLPAILGMKVNPLIRSGEVWRLITPVLLHGGLIHLLGNMYGLFIFGPELERNFGRGRFVALYLLSGFAGNVMSFLFSPNPSYGASTAVFGLLGAEGVFLYYNRALLGRSGQRALGNIIMVAVLNLIIGIAPRIDSWGHLGGLIGGMLFTLIGGPIWVVEGIYPTYNLVDRRDVSDAARAALIVFLIFASLALAGILFRST